MRAAVALFALVGLGSCGSPTPGDVLWFGPGSDEQNYVLTVDEPDPY